MFVARRRILKHYSIFNRFLATSNEPKEIKVPVPWGHVAGKQWGESSQPLVVCLHGYLDNAGSYDKLIPLLPQNYCYLAMDFPGHGFSSPCYNGLPYTDDLYSESLCRVQRYFGKKKIGIIGHSMGAAISVKYMFDYIGAASFSVTVDMAVIPPNCMLERVKHAGRRMDKIMRQFLIKDKEPARTMEELIGGMVVGWGGSLDREAAEVLLKRGAKPFGDKFKLTRELPCGNNQIWSQNTQCLIGYDPTPIDLSMCAIEFLQGFRFYNQKLLENYLKYYVKSFKMVEYHKIRGTHHHLLTHPQVVSKVITEFIDRAEHQ